MVGHGARLALTVSGHAMAIAEAPPAAESARARSLDLKRSLTLRVVATAFACFLVSALLALYGTYRETRQANARVADLVARQLEMQLWRIGASIDIPARFPDWDPVADRAQAAGQCIRYMRPDGRLGRAGCIAAGDGVPPAWIATLGARLLGPGTEVARPVAFQGRPHGTVVVATDASSVLAAIWRDVSRLLGLTALLVGTICVLQYMAIGRALRPTRDILAGLDRLARGDLSCRLPRFRLTELRRISEVFNALAASLDRTTRERAQLAARLVDGQEQERRHLARELHDDLAQTLSAISATAASIRATAEARCPALVPEASRLAETTLATMRSLRATLEALRPPEIEDFGLTASLAALVREQERRVGGTLRVHLKTDGNLDSLPLTAAAHVYRIVQESLANIAKHANAGEAHVLLGVQPDAGRASGLSWLTLAIEDDGTGAGGCTPASEGTGLGLTGMRERAMALGGRLEVVKRNGGFRIEAVIPFAAAEAGP
jgi:signal transduction histidine kinase